MRHLVLRAHNKSGSGLQSRAREKKSRRKKRVAPEKKKSRQGKKVAPTQSHRMFLSEKPPVTSGNFCLRISLTYLYVLLSSMRFLFTKALLSIYSTIFVSWPVGQSIQTKQMAINDWLCQSVEFETAFKYSLETRLFFALMITSLPTAKKVPFLLFW